MEIREACLKDIKNIAELYISNWKSTYKDMLSSDYLNQLNVQYGIDKWSKFLKEDEHRIFVVYDGDDFLGFGACSPDSEIEDCLYMDSLHIYPESQGKGIGTELTQRIRDYALDNGYTKMSVCIVRGNDGARDLYLKLGAKHYSYFTDDFDGTKSNSEKLLWNIDNK